MTGFVRDGFGWHPTEARPQAPPALLHQHQNLRTRRPATGVSRALRARETPESVPRGVFGARRALGSGVSKKCPESVPGVSKRCPGHSGDTLGTLFGHSGFWGPTGPKNTPRDTLGTLRARRARETPVAGRQVRKSKHESAGEVPGTDLRCPNFDDQYDWTTGAPDNGKEWRKCGIVPRAHPLRPVFSLQI